MRTRLWARFTVAIFLLLVAGFIVGNWPVMTRYGVDYKWSVVQIPLYEKAINFLSRDFQARRLAKEVTRGALDDQDKILKIFYWIGENVRPTPEGFPVKDDHVLNIIIRGYGAPDQRSEAFALMASYAGFPGSVATLKVPGAVNTLVVALVQTREKTILLDVNNQILFRNQNGSLADLEDLLRDPRLIAGASGRLKIHGIPYEWYFMELKDLRPTFFRMEQQKPWSRLKSEVMGFFGLGSGRSAP